MNNTVIDKAILGHAYTCAQRVAPALSTLTGDVWEATPIYEHYARLTGPDGAEIGVRVETYGANKDKAEFTGVYPRVDLPYGVGHHSTRATLTRTGDAIAKQLTTRLLPVYLPDLTRVRVAIDATAIAAVARIDMFNECNRITGATQGRYQTDSEVSWSGDAWGDVRLRHAGDGGTLTVHCESRELVTGLLHIIAQYNRAHSS